MLRLIPVLILFSFPLFAQGLDVDNDGDGWTENQGDCCDVPSASCTEPALVNPGAFEILGNSVDDNCNGTVDEPRQICDAALASNSADPNDYAKALDVCQSTVEIPPIQEKHWGLINAQLTLADGTGTPATFSRALRADYGNGVNPPTFGGRMAVFSTGRAADKNDTSPSYLAPQPGGDMMTQSPFPADWYAANGSTLPNAPGCPSPQGSAAYDPVMLTLRLRVPTNARSFRFASRFFSSEYPEFVCSPFNDLFVVLLDSTFNGTPANPEDKNLARYFLNSGAYPVGVNLASGNTGLFQACVNGSTGCGFLAVPGNTNSCTSVADLAGTGHEDNSSGNCDADSRVGGGTVWVTTQGNVVPGEIITLRIAVWDTSDHIYDSLVLLDNLQWSTGTVKPGTFHSYTSLESSPNPSQTGQPVTFTARVTAALGSPSGNIIFKEGSVVLGTRALDPSGEAELTTSALSAGNHSITAHYQGGGGFPASSSTALNQAVQGSGNVRTWVATTGVDTNPCSRSLPCRTFSTAAIAVNAGGEIVVADSGGYGAVTLTKSVTVVSAEGIHAAIAPTAGNAITVSAGSNDVIVLRGLYLNAQGAANGIVFNSGAALQVENCVISGFSSQGIHVPAALAILVADTQIRGNGSDGIRIDPVVSHASATILKSRLENNGGAGLAVIRGKVDVNEVLSAGNETGFRFSEGTVSLRRSAALRNVLGVSAEGNIELAINSMLIAMNATGIDLLSFGNAVRVRNSTITANTVGIANLDPVYSFGNNRLAGNGTNGAFQLTIPHQ